MSDISMREMLEAGVHFGHKTRYWNPKMKPFIYGARFKVHIINLEHTLPMFQEALDFIAKVASRRGKILFVGTKHAAQEIIRQEATRCGMPYVDYRWLGGMLTNYKTIRQSIKRYKELEALLASTKIEQMTKKELLTLVREKDKLHACLSGIKNMNGLPDALFIIDVGLEKIAVTEARRLSIPVVGIVDTNTNPEGIDYPVPGNDDAVRSIQLYCKTVADVILEARGALDAAEEEVAAAALPVETEDKAAVKKIITKKTRAQRSLASEYDEDAAEETEEVAAVAEPVADVALLAEEAKPVKKVVKKVVAKAEVSPEVADSAEVVKAAPKKKVTKPKQEETKE